MLGNYKQLGPLDFQYALANTLLERCHCRLLWMICELKFIIVYMIDHICWQFWRGNLEGIIGLGAGGRYRLWAKQGGSRKLSLIRLYVLSSWRSSTLGWKRIPRNFSPSRCTPPARSSCRKGVCSVWIWLWGMLENYKWVGTSWISTFILMASHVDYDRLRGQSSVPDRGKSFFSTPQSPVQ
jgi:hypothetical protein